MKVCIVDERLTLLSNSIKSNKSNAMKVNQMKNMRTLDESKIAVGSSEQRIRENSETHVNERLMPRIYG